MDYFESQCAHCSKVFTSEKGLKKHKFEDHYLIDNAYDCDECGKIGKSLKIIQYGAF